MVSILRRAIFLGLEETDNFIKKRLMAVGSFILITAVFSAAAPLALKFAVDALGTGGFKSLDLPLLQGWGISDQSSLIIGPAILILIYIFSLWLSRSSGELRWYFYGTADQRLHRNISRRLFDHVMKLPLEFHLDRQTGALNQILGQGVAGYSIVFNHLVFTLFPVLIEIAVISVVLAFFLSPGFIFISVILPAKLCSILIMPLLRISIPAPFTLVNTLP